MSLLEAVRINVVYEPFRGAEIHSVRDVSLRIEHGEIVGLVGESGCGKSTLAYALTKMLHSPARFVSGKIFFKGEDITDLSGENLRLHRRKSFALVLQSGMNALNPVISIEDHFVDVMRAYEKVKFKDIRSKAELLLKSVHLPQYTLERYPHELSGGMRQRVAIALALALDPQLVIFDEPTTALDVLAQEAVIATIRELQHSFGFSALLVSHDLGLVLDATDRVMVMYAGRVVENQNSSTMYKHAQHPYTKALLDCYADPRAEEVKLGGIPGSPPDLSSHIDGCSFQPRCNLAEAQCSLNEPPLYRSEFGHVACFVASQKTKENLNE